MEYNFFLVFFKGTDLKRVVIFHLLTDPDEINTAYAKLKKKIVPEIFCFSIWLLRKL